jgi:hypothetical protein
MFCTVVAVVLHFSAAAVTVNLGKRLSSVAKSILACCISFADDLPVVIIFDNLAFSSSLNTTEYISFGI